MEDAIDSLVSFSDFVYAFQIQFYYEGDYSTTVTIHWLHSDNLPLASDVPGSNLARAKLNGPLSSAD